jgi:hypothetical protein
LIQALDMTHTKIRSNPAKKHGNIPLWYRIEIKCIKSPKKEYFFGLFTLK